MIKLQLEIELVFLFIIGSSTLKSHLRLRLSMGGKIRKLNETYLEGEV